MAKPFVLLVTNITSILHDIQEHIQQEYTDLFTIYQEQSSQQAIAVLERLQHESATLALFIAPYQPENELFQRVSKLFPQAKRILLITWEQTKEALQAINARLVDDYVTVAQAPEACLFPTLDNLLSDWSAAFEPPPGQMRVIGHRWSAKAYALKDFLARNQIPYQWLNIEEQDEAQKLLEYIGSTSKKLPVVIFPDDSYLVDPDTTEVAEKVNLKTHAETRFYDLVIVGSGPAGLAAGVYAASEGLRTLLVEKNAPGGQAGSSSHIDNYLGFPAGLSGADLARRAVTQAERFGAEIVTPQEVTSIRVHGQYRIVTLGDGSQITCNAILLATGVAYRQLDVAGIEQLNGVGVYYGASTTEGIACQDEEIFIVGGANSAGQAALYFSKYARKVTLLVRGKSLSSSMSRYLVEQIEETENIEVCVCTSIVAVSGEKRLEGITLHDEDSKEERTIKASSLFIFIGAQPHTEQFANLLQRDEHGFLLTGPDLRRVGPNRWALKREPYLLESSVPGIFVAGDVRANSIKRVAAGVGEGSMAVQFIERYLNQA